MLPSVTSARSQTTCPLSSTSNVDKDGAFVVRELVSG